jgi:hypothetical protein
MDMGDTFGADDLCSFHGKAHLLAGTVTHVSGQICHPLTDEAGLFPISLDRTL